MVEIKNIKPKIIKFLPILVVLVLVIGVVLYLTKIKNHNEQTAPVETQETSNEPAFSPPTEEEKAQTEQHKQEIAQQAEQGPTPPPPAGQKTVTPLISFADQVEDSFEAAAFVPGITEDGGSCTLTAAQGNKTVTKTVPANRNASTTDCQAFTIPRTEFPAAGEWQVKVSYKSATASGTSEAWATTIQ